MPRPARPQVAGGLYHVTANSNCGRVVFRDNDEREQFLGFVEAGVTRYGWSCHSYCLLSTHYHLLVATPQPNISAGMQYLGGRYGQWANWHREERSHVFAGRFGSRLVVNESHALEVHRYIALNPVRAGLVRDPEAWRWSSLPAILGLAEAPAFLDVDAVFDELGSTRSAARRRLRRFIQDGLEMDAA